MKTIEDIKNEVGRLASILGAPDDTLPSFAYEDNGRPYIEVDRHGYHLLARDRDRDTLNITTTDFNELLYHVFKEVITKLAYRHPSVCHSPSRDYRRRLFEQKNNLMAILSKEWAQRLESEHEQILLWYPSMD